MSSTRDTTATPHQGPRHQLIADLPVSERRLHLQGITTPVLEGGDGPPVVLLHGPGYHATSWRRIIPDLVRTHHVIVPDLPGHGASTVDEGSLDGDRMLAWLGDLIDATCAEPPTLVGKLAGGGLAAHFAATSDVGLHQVVLIQALGLRPFEPPPDFGQALGTFAEDPNEQTHDDFWGKCVVDLDGVRDRMGATWDHFRAYNIETAQSPAVAEARDAMLAAYGFRALPDEVLRRVPDGTALIWGAEHRPTPLEVAEDMSARYGWSLHVIDDCGDPLIERPDAFLTTLRTVMSASQREVAR